MGNPESGASGNGQEDAFEQFLAEPANLKKSAKPSPEARRTAAEKGLRKKEEARTLQKEREALWEESEQGKRMRLVMEELEQLPSLIRNAQGGKTKYVQKRKKYEERLLLAAAELDEFKKERIEYLSTPITDSSTGELPIAVEEERRPETREERVLHAIIQKADDLHVGRIESDVDGVSSYVMTKISHVTGPDGRQVSLPDGQPPSVRMIVEYPRDERGLIPRDYLTFGPDGVVRGNFSAKAKAKGIDEETVVGDLLEKLERYYGEQNAVLKNWHQIDVDFLPPGESVRVPSAREAGTAGEPRFDQERIDHLNVLLQNKQALFGIRENKPIQRASHAVVFSDFLVIDNPWTANALYIVDIPRVQKDVVPREQELFRAWLVRQELLKRMSLSRAQLRQQFGADRVIHTPGKDWQADVRKILERKIEEAGGKSESRE